MAAEPEPENEAALALTVSHGADCEDHTEQFRDELKSFFRILSNLEQLYFLPST